MTLDRASSAAVAAAVAALALAGCDTLEARPGSDFALQILTPMPIELRQRVDPVEIAFRLSDCEDFDVAVLYSDTPLPIASGGDGSYSVTIAPELVTSRWSVCGAADEEPVTWHLTLYATCRDGRQAGANVDFTLEPLPWVSNAMSAPGAPIDPARLLPLDDGRFLALAGGRLWACEVSGKDVACGYEEVLMPSGLAGEGSLLASDGRRAFFVPSCALGGACEPAPETSFDVEGVGPVVLPASTVDAFELGGERHIDRQERLEIPSPMDLGVDSNGELVGLGQILTRIAEGQAPRYVGGGDIPQSKLTRLADGRLAYLAWRSDHLVLRTVQGEAVQSFRGDALKTGRFFIDPRRPRWIVIQDQAVWLGGESEPWVPLSVAPEINLDWLQVAWLDDAVALWQGGLLQLFPFGGSDRAALQSKPESGQLRGVAGNARVLVVASDTGVRIFDRQGALLGGSDPLRCGWEPTSPPAIVGEQALVTTDAYLLGFDLSAY